MYHNFHANICFTLIFYFSSYSNECMLLLDDELHNAVMK